MHVFLICMLLGAQPGILCVRVGVRAGLYVYVCVLACMCACVCVFKCDTTEYRKGEKAVSYTHLTLPTMAVV